LAHRTAVEPGLDLSTRRVPASDEQVRAHVWTRVAALVDQRRAAVRQTGFRPAYVVRLQEIRRLKEVHRARLEHAYAELAARLGHDDESFGREWRAVAASWSFARVNRLIDEHNARYPIERSLPFDPEAGDYTAIGGRPYRRALLDAGWVFERFPPVLAAR
jgi:hypothetical protein